MEGNTYGGRDASVERFRLALESLMVKKNTTLADCVGIALATLFVINNVSPFLTRFGHPLRRAFLIYALWGVTVLVTDTDIRQRIRHEAGRRKVELLALTGWLVTLIMNATFSRGFTWDLHLLHGINMVLTVTIGLYYSAQPNRKFDQFVALSMALLGLEVLRSLPTLWREPAIARISMQVFEVRDEFKEDAIRASIGQYGFYTALAIVIPVLLSKAFVARGAVKTSLMFSAMTFIGAVIMSTFMGAVVLLAVGATAVSILHFLVTTKKVKVLGGYLAVLLLVGFTWGLLLAGSEQISYVFDKFTAQVTSVGQLGLKGDQTSRLELWEMSLNTFVQHPAFGIGPTTGRENEVLHRMVGGHAAWLDQLAEYGLIGSGLYWLWLCSAIRRIASMTRKHWGFRRMRVVCIGQLIACGLFVVGGMYNPVTFILEMYTLFILLATNVPASLLNEAEFAARRSHSLFPRSSLSVRRPFRASRGMQ
jgi:hypothetical protein